MERKDIDIKSLMYDPFNTDTVKKLEEYDEFKPKFGVDKEKLCAYVILCYDLNTQLRKEVTYFNQRKILAAELAGFPKTHDKKFLEQYENVMIGKNKIANQAISKYIRLFASPKYTSLVYYWSIQSAEFENVISGKESRDYKNTTANIQNLENLIKECTEELFGGDETTDIRKALYESVEKENLNLRPEAIASSDNVDDLLDNPYIDDRPGAGIWFKPGTHKYRGRK